MKCSEIKQIETIRDKFIHSLLPGHFWTEEELEQLQLDPLEIQLKLELVGDILWACSERQAIINQIGTEAEQAYAAAENALPSPEEIDIDSATREQMLAIQDGVWNKVLRLVTERKLIRGAEICALYDEINQPYFKLSYIEAMKGALIKDNSLIF